MLEFPSWTRAKGVLVAMIVAGLWAKSASAAEGDNAYAKQRAALVAEIEDDYRRTVGYTGLERMSEPVRKAMLAVPRHEFVRTDGTAEAYGNYPLGIGHGQTISQPYIVALMTDLLAVEANHRVLEIGTGSGYQAAVLSEIAARVYTIEIVKPLADAARERLARLGYDDVQVRAGDGNLGWPSEAPFDGIIVTAAGNIPPALVEQLKPGGRLVIPIDLGGGSQELTVVTKAQDGSISKRPVLPVRFVPLTGDN